MKRYNLNVIHTAVWQVEVLAENEEQARAIAEMRVGNIGLQGCDHHELDCTTIEGETDELKGWEMSGEELAKWQSEKELVNGEIENPRKYTEEEIKGMTLEELDELELSDDARVKVQLAMRDETLTDEQFIERFATIAICDLCQP